MTSRNLTEVFVIMRNNALHNRQMYAEDRPGSDSEKLLKKSIHDAEEGLEMRDDCSAPPVWFDKLEEAQYTISKIKPKLDELGSLHARHLLRPTLDDRCEEENLIEELSQEISKLITSTHRHIQCIRSSLGHGNKTEQRLTKNVVTCMLNGLQDISNRYRQSQSNYLRQLSSREARSNVFFETPDFTTIDLNDKNSDDGTTNSTAYNHQQQQQNNNSVETFDNFLVPSKSLSSSSALGGGYMFDTDEQIDHYFQQPITSKMTQQQLLLFEEENTKMAEHREQEVTKIVKSILDLNDIFKDLAGMVQEQGTVLDRIDYNVEQTQTRVTEGYKQLQKAEVYQRKNRKMYCILILAGITLLMMILLIIMKF